MKKLLLFIMLLQFSFGFAQNQFSREGVEKFQNVGSKACACDAIAIAKKLKFSMNFFIIILLFKKPRNIKQ